MISTNPLLPWLAAVVAAALLVVSWFSGDLEGRRGVVLVSWFAGALALQVFASSAVFSLLGLVLQTALAVYLLVVRQQP